MMLLSIHRGAFSPGRAEGLRECLPSHWIYFRRRRPKIGVRGCEIFHPIEKSVPRRVATVLRTPADPAMTLKYSPTTIAVSLLILGAACAAPQDLQHRLVRARVPILYEAYYPEQRNLSPRANLEEIRKLRELTSKLLKQEEELGKLAAAVAEANPENVFEPRGQILEYVFSGQALPVPLPPAPLAATKNDDVEVASITVTDTGRHKRRHHHGEAEWMLRGVAAPSTR